MTSKHALRALVASFAVLLAAPPLLAKELAGVKVADTLSVGGKTLALNGLGLRKKAIFKVYVGGLYLEAPSKDAGAILAADAPKAVAMHFVRGIGKEKLVEAFQEGFENNAKDKMAAEKASIDKFLSWTSDVKDGDAWTFAYTPGKGTAVMHGDKEMGTIEGKGFADVLFSLWLGPKPPSEDLKKGMLGL
jgi:hypothetical protein